MGRFELIPWFFNEARLETTINRPLVTFSVLRGKFVMHCGNMSKRITYLTFIPGELF